MHPKKAKRVFNVMNIISEDGKMMVALAEVENRSCGGEKLQLSDLEERKHNGVFILGEAQSTPMALSKDAYVSEELLNDDSEDQTLINYDGILVVDKAPQKRASNHQQENRTAPVDIKSNNTLLVDEEEYLSEDKVEHIIASNEDRFASNETTDSQNNALEDDISADELNQLDDELDAIMNTNFDTFQNAATAAELISIEKAARGDDLINWTSYTNKHDAVLDLTRPHDNHEEFVNKTYMIGTSRVVAASESVKRVLVESLFPEEGAITNADLEGFEFTEEEIEKESASINEIEKSDDKQSKKYFGLGLELAEEENEAKEALDFFESTITSNSLALNRATLDGIRGLACLPTKEEEDRIVYGDEIDAADNFDDDKSAISRRTRLSRLSSIGGYTNLSKLSNKSIGSSVQMRRGRHMNQKHFTSGESMDTELNRMMDVANEKIARTQVEYSQNDQAEPFLTNEQKLNLLTEDSIKNASLENLYNMSDDVNHGQDKHIGTNMMDNEEIVDGLVDCIMSGQVARAYIRCSWNKLGYGKQKLDAQRQPTIEDDAEALHYIGKADDKNMQIEANKAPIKIVLSKKGIPITSLTTVGPRSLPIVHEENEDSEMITSGQKQSKEELHDITEKYRPYVLPSTRENETSTERADRKALTKQLKRERRMQKKVLGEVFSNERRTQAAVQFREKSNVQGRRIA